MNETRKQIIELIEPYMDKTRCFGCLFLIGNNIEQLVSQYKYLTFDEDVSSYEKTLYHMPTDSKIIGHYDITAVLKYIQSIKGRTLKIRFLGYFEIYDIYPDGERLMGYINNIPLRLYTKQKEKELLELLLKLK